MLFILEPDTSPTAASRHSIICANVTGSSNWKTKFAKYYKETTINIWTSFIAQFVHLVAGEGMGVNLVDRCNRYFS